jgi:hypothetical protein
VASINGLPSGKIYCEAHITFLSIGDGAEKTKTRGDRPGERERRGWRARRRRRRRRGEGGIKTTSSPR